jgi:hypothetical protein
VNIRFTFTKGIVGAADSGKMDILGSETSLEGPGIGLGEGEGIWLILLLKQVTFLKRSCEKHWMRKSKRKERESMC